MRTQLHSTIRRAARPIASACAATLLLAATACGGSGDSDSSGSSDEEITLTIGLFGDLGFAPLYEEYEQAHPNITVKERVTQMDDHHNQLVSQLATGSGAADIVAVEADWIGTYTDIPDRFHDLRDYGAAGLESAYLDWKWAQGTAADGTVIGLGTDVGGLALCYRRDLFEQAGLPTGREELAERWTGWEEYIGTGREFAAAGLEGTSFVDGTNELFRAMVAQAPTGLYNEDNEIIAGSNPHVRQAWDWSTEIIRDGLSAGLDPFSEEWNTGFAKGSFATVICPAWMGGYIEEQAPDAQGRWDIARVPGGGGNVGGSHLLMPAQGEHPEEAADLITFLLSEENQKRIFEENGFFPSLPALYDDPAVQNYTRPYFGDTPVGQIYSAAAENLQPQHLGPQQRVVRDALSSGLARIAQGSETPDEAWEHALSDIDSLG